MTDQITHHQYHAEVRSIAQDLLTEVRDDNPGELADSCIVREALEERLWETIDGHQWVIYTYKAQQIIALSSNDSYSAENFGAESIVTEDGDIKWEAIAFGALYADVSEILWGLHGESVDRELFDHGLSGKEAN